MRNSSDAASARAGDLAAWTFFVAVAKADRLSALLNEDIARKARRAGLTGRTSNYNAIRLADSEFRLCRAKRWYLREAGSQADECSEALAPRKTTIRLGSTPRPRQRRFRRLAGLGRCSNAGPARLRRYSYRRASTSGPRVGSPSAEDD